METSLRVTTVPTSTMLSSLPTPTNPTDLSAYKLSSPPPSSKSPDDRRSDSVSPASSPPPVSGFPPPPGSGLGGLPPSSSTTGGISMVSMASILTRPPSFGFPGTALGFPAPGGAAFPPKDFPRLPGAGGDYGSPVNPLTMIQNRPYTRSPPPMVAPNDPTANDCKIVDYRGEKIAAFMINNKTMLCLPQAFELFLKNLVGGLHTVYTKCKRLEIIPMICNVEQVRVLRGLGAIQPGVNRCKLIADTDFDTLYKDCTTSRPPKRVMPFPAMSPQDAMLRLQQTGGGPAVPTHPPPTSVDHHFSPFSLGGGGGGPGAKDVVGGFPMVNKDGSGAAGIADRFGGIAAAAGGLPPHPAAMGHLMSLNNPAAQAALLRGSGVLPGALPGLTGLQLPGSSPQALLESYKQSYGDMLKHLQGLQKPPSERQGSTDMKDDIAEPDNSVLNLSRTQSDTQEDISVRSESDIGEVDPTSDDDMDESKGEEDKRRGEDEAMKGEEGKMGNTFHMMKHIQSLISMAMENAKEGGSEKDSPLAIRKKIDEESKTTDFYLKRFKKEKRLRKQLEEQLELESRKIVKLENALRNLSYDTLIKVKESIARDAAQREKEKLKGKSSGSTGSTSSHMTSDKSADAQENAQNSSREEMSASSSPATGGSGAGDFHHSINYSVAALERSSERSPVASAAAAASLFPPTVTSMAHTAPTSY